MDGTNREILHDTDLLDPYGITLDYESQTLYWVDYSLNKLESSKTDGSDRIPVTTVSINDPFDITYHNGRVYWTDFYDDSILTTSIDSPDDVTLLSQYVGSDPYGIHAITEESQPEGTS